MRVKCPMPDLDRAERDRGESETSCAHSRLKQMSAVVAETFWSRNGADDYEPEPRGPICLSRIVSEETLEFVCVECGESLTPPTA
jgi:hypothetical protein